MPSAALTSCSPIVELRQYTLRPGHRDDLIDLFDSRLVEPQERGGMKVIGQFRDLDDPDRFVWLRGFEGMPQRARQLADFYDGPVWHAHRAAAVATMIDSDDVLLLRPAQEGSAFLLEADREAALAAPLGERGFVSATIMYLEAPAEQTGILPFFEHAIAFAVAGTGSTVLGWFTTEPSENDFPRLPVRSGEQVFVWFAGHPDRQALGAGGAIESIAMRAPGLSRPSQVLRLSPTSRSLLHGRSSACRNAPADPTHPTVQTETR